MSAVCFSSLALALAGRSIRNARPNPGGPENLYGAPLFQTQPLRHSSRNNKKHCLLLITLPAWSLFEMKAASGPVQPDSDRKPRWRASR